MPNHETENLTHHSSSERQVLLSPVHFRRPWNQKRLAGVSGWDKPRESLVARIPSRTSNIALTRTASFFHSLAEVPWSPRIRFSFCPIFPPFSLSQSCPGDEALTEQRWFCSGTLLTLEISKVGCLLRFSLTRAVSWDWKVESVQRIEQHERNLCSTP